MVKVTPILGMCSTKRKNMGFQFVSEGDRLIARGAFYDYGGGEKRDDNVSGKFYTDPSFKCACGKNHLYQCHSCGKFICYDGSALTDAVCPICGSKDSVPASNAERRIACSVKPVGKLDIVLAIDISGSMGGSRLDTVIRSAINEFVNKYEGNKNCRMALISFESSVVVQSYLTTDLGKIRRLIKGFKPAGGTNSPLNKVLTDKGFSEFLNSSNNRYLVIFTDGEWSHTRSEHIGHANKIKNKGIKILSIGCSGADSAFLKAISSPDGSIVTNDAGITEAFATIAKKSSQ